MLVANGIAHEFLISLLCFLIMIIGSALNYGYASKVTFSYASAIRLALISIALKSINGYGLVNKIPLKVIVESQ